MSAAHDNTTDVEAESVSEKIQSLNQQMFELANAREWEAVGHLLKARNRLIRQLDGEERRAAIVASQECMQKLLRLAETARTEVADQLSSLMQGKKAAHAYRAHA